ncbi:hypothetical protein AR687_20490 [Flavobacteriaceae bacterium CRH]|nr:hypothetical protein AR687_20490 [Flavobacteriaceae bacterium CRH]
MRKILYITILILLFINCNNSDKSTGILKNETTIEYNDSGVSKKEQKEYELKSILGKWAWQSEDKSQQFTIDFIKFSNDSVYAKYCSVYNNGAKLDCDFDETIINIRGVIENEKKLKVKFNSFFNAKNGLAEIIITENKELKWKIIDSPKGEFYAPSECILKPKVLLKVTGDNRVNLPFDFEEKNKLANSEKKKYLELYPQIMGDKLFQIKKIISENTEDNPDEIYQINNGNLGFDSFIYCTYGDSDSQTLINVKNNKIIANEALGYAMPENKTYQSFVINKDLTINIYDIDYNSRLKKILEKYQIKQDGSIAKIK